MAVVRVIIPKPTETLIEIHHVAPYNDTLLKYACFPLFISCAWTANVNICNYGRRIHTLSSFVDKTAHVYALGKILPTATWRTYQPFGDHRSELCNPVTNDPIVVWTVGHVASAWFLRNGYPEKQASITIVPLSHTLMHQTACLLNGLASPPIGKVSQMSLIVLFLLNAFQRQHWMMHRQGSALLSGNVRKGQTLQ